MDKKLFTHDFIRSLGFSAYRLAKETNITISSMSKYVHGTVEPNLKTARKICAVLNVPLDSVEFLAERPTV